MLTFAPTLLLHTVIQYMEDEDEDEEMATAEKAWISVVLLSISKHPSGSRGKSCHLDWSIDWSPSHIQQDQRNLNMGSTALHRL